MKSEKWNLPKSGDGGKTLKYESDGYTPPGEWKQEAFSVGFRRKEGVIIRFGIQKEWAFGGALANRGSFGVNCVLGQIWVNICQLQLKIDKILILWWNYEKRGHCSLTVD